MDIACVGDISIDSYTNMRLDKPGGIAFNVASHIPKTKYDLSLFSAVGDDLVGKKLTTLLESLDIEHSHVQMLKGKTAIQHISLHDTGERMFTGYEAGVLTSWDLTVDDLHAISSHDAIFVPLSDGMERIFEHIIHMKTEAVKFVDFSQDYEHANFDKKDNDISRYCTYFDIIFIGGAKKHIPLVTCLSKQYPNKPFILSLGKNGSIGFDSGVKYVQPAKKVPHVVDTTGCGDAFQAGFISSYIKSRNLTDALHHAAESVVHALQHIGSTTHEIV